MAAPSDPAHKAAVVRFLIEHPEISYRDAGAKFGVKISTMQVWINRERKRLGSLAVPLRPQAGIRPQAGACIVSLPTPTLAPVVLDPEMTALARKAARQILEHLADPKNLKGVSLKDAASTLKVLTDSYDLLAPMDAAKPGTSKRVGRLTEALLGKLPDDGEDEDELDIGFDDVTPLAR